MFLSEESVSRANGKGNGDGLMIDSLRWMRAYKSSFMCVDLVGTTDKSREARYLTAELIPLNISRISQPIPSRLLDCIHVQMYRIETGCLGRGSSVVVEGGVAGCIARN